jgi:hypothetical protein
MPEKTFDYNVRDSQGTDVVAVSPEKFDIDAYKEYEESLLAANKQFWNSKSGVAVYRRFRVPEVFSYGCRDMKHSLELQLGALQESMKYKMDIANFLEPWYGIGTIASAYGLDYIWNENQAPATLAPFKSLDEALAFEYKPVEDTAIGRHTLNMIEYFLEKTKGKIPMSLTDTQSPLNIASYLFDITTLFLEMYDNPDGYKSLLETISNLLIDFTKKQVSMIGDAIASPGHGFASSRCFKGIGMSDDNMLMLSDEMYEELEIPYREKVGVEFGGVAFHSCGNWSKKIDVVKKIKNLVTVDGAFSPQTDPDPNTLEPFSDGFVNTGVIINARIVGDVEEITKTVKKIWRNGMKLIVVTYCETPEEQEKAYNNIHEICGC